MEIKKGIKKGSNYSSVSLLSRTAFGFDFVAIDGSWMCGFDAVESACSDATMANNTSQQQQQQQKYHLLLFSTHVHFTHPHPTHAHSSYFIPRGLVVFYVISLFFYFILSSLLHLLSSLLVTPSDQMNERRQGKSKRKIIIFRLFFLFSFSFLMLALSLCSYVNLKNFGRCEKNCDEEEMIRKEERTERMENTQTETATAQTLFLMRK